jgi:hypothetical protein
MVPTAPMRAKAKVITEISARSRKPTRVDVSIVVGGLPDRLYAQGLRVDS